jgi:allantoin racemase
MRILLVNPNTTASMTEKAAVAARVVAASGTEIIAATSRMGPVSIEGHYDGALAIPGLLAELKERQTEGYDAAIIACFDDTGLEAARSFCDVPVLGLCESAVATAGFLAQRFTVVTTLERSRVLIDNLVRRYGMGDRVKVRASDIPVLELENEASGAIGKLRAEIERALDEDGAEAIVLGGNSRRITGCPSSMASRPPSSRPKRWFRSVFRPASAAPTPRRWRSPSPAR